MNGKVPIGQISIDTFMRIADELREVKHALSPETTIEFYTIDDVLWYELRSAVKENRMQIMFEAP